MRAEGLRVLVTGAGSGIGRALALQAARAGARVAICGRRRTALDETAALATGAAMVVIEADLTRAEDRAIVVARLAESFGGLDVLVNNAGLMTGGALADMTDENIETTIATNVVAPIALTRDVLPLMRPGAARVVNIGSVFGDISFPGFAVYSASKFALRGFSDALRRELAPKGIGVTYAAPRATRTPGATSVASLVENAGMKLDDPQVVASQIWLGILASRDRIYPAGPEKLFVLVERLFPALVSRALAPHAVRLLFSGKPGASA